MHKRRAHPGISRSNLCRLAGSSRYELCQHNARGLTVEKRPVHHDACLILEFHEAVIAGPQIRGLDGTQYIGKEVAAIAIDLITRPRGDVPGLCLRINIDAAITGPDAA